MTIRARFGLRALTWLTTLSAFFLAGAFSHRWVPPNHATLIPTSQPQPSVRIEYAVFDAGIVEPGDLLTDCFKLRNVGKATLRIRGVGAFG